MLTFPDATFSDTPENPSIFLSTFPSDKPVEEPTLFTDSARSDFPPSKEPSSLSSRIFTDIPTEEQTLPS